MTLIKVAPHRTCLVSVHADGTATERWLTTSTSAEFAEATSGEWPAEVTAQDQGAWRIDVGPYHLVAEPTGEAGCFGGTETGPHGECFFHVFTFARTLSGLERYHEYRWLLVGRDHPPSIVELPAAVGGRTIATDVLNTRPFGVGRLQSTAVTDGLLQLDFTLVWDRQREDTELFKVRSTPESVVLEGTSYTLHPLAESSTSDPRRSVRRTPTSRHPGPRARRCARRGSPLGIR